MTSSYLMWLSYQGRLQQLEARRARLVAAIADKPADDPTIPFAREDIADIDLWHRAVASLLTETKEN